jgi:plastocyanin
MRIAAVMLAGALLMSGCARGKDSVDNAARQVMALKLPMAAAVENLGTVAHSVADGNLAAGREAYQSFAMAFGQVLGPVSFKDSAVATRLANANTALQEDLEHGRADRATVKQHTDELMKALYAAADVLGVSLNGGAAAAALQPPRVIDVTAREYRFDPALIRVQQGERITIRLHNAGTVAHEWESDALHAKVPPVQPGGTGEVTFTAEHPGTYEFVCDLDNHDERGMQGFVVVK